MKCPKCGVKTAAGAAECPGCGVIFAKLEKLKDRAKKQADAPMSDSEAPSPILSAARADPWLGRKIAAAIILVWIIGFGLYYRRSLREARERVLKTPVRDRSALIMRDPVTGELKAIPVVKSPSTKKER